MTEKPTHYTITVTAEQAAVISSACEVMARLGIGQIWAALDKLPLKERWAGSWELREAVERVVADHINGGMGIHHKGVTWNARAAWDLHATIRHRLAWDRAIADGVVAPGQPRNWSTMIGVAYDQPLPFEDVPRVKIEEAKP